MKPIMGVLAVSSLAACCGAVTAVEQAPINKFTERQERAQTYEFVEKPAVSKNGNKWVVSFTSKAACDATVAVVGKDGKIVRHLASGVLGKNAPWPFKPARKASPNEAGGQDFDGLSQKIEWDGKDDQGKAAPADCKVTVSLGLNYGLDKAFGFNPYGYGMLPVVRGESGYMQLGCMAVDAAGCLYLSGSYKDETFVRVFDRSGTYLRALLPTPAINASSNRCAMANWGETTWGATVLLRRGDGGSSPFSLLGNWGPTLQRPFFTADGKLALQCMTSNSQRAPKAANRIIFFNTKDGSVTPNDILDLEAHCCSSCMLPSKDGKSVYLSADLDLDEKAKAHTVRRMSLDNPKEIEIYLGATDAGNGDSQFNTPSSLSFDQDGNLYVADRGNNRIQVFSPEKTLLASIPVELPRKIEVHPKTGVIYVLCAGKNAAKLVKIGGMKTPAVQATLEFPYPTFKGRQKLTNCMFALDATSEPAGLWLSADPIIRVADMGDRFDKTVDFGDEAKKLGLWDEWPGVHGGGASGQRGATLAADPNSDLLIVGKKKVDGLTGRMQDPKAIWSLTHQTQSPYFGPDGLMYAKVEAYSMSYQNWWVVRYDPVTMKPVPFSSVDVKHPFPEAKGSAPDEKVGAENLGPFLGRALYTKKAQQQAEGIIDNGNRSFQHFMTVAPNGDIYAYAQPDKQAYLPLLEKAGIPVPDPKNKAVYLLSVFSQNGKLKTACALPGMRGTDGGVFVSCVRVGQRGALYVSSSLMKIGTKGPDGLSAETIGKSNAKWWGSVVKFASSFDKYPAGAIVGGWDSTPVATPTHILYPLVLRRPVQVKNEHWTFEGVAPLYDGGGCTCRTSTFDLDPFERVYLPTPVTQTVTVLDANGNVIVRLGGYGNEDSMGRDSAVVDPKTGEIRPRRAGDPSDLQSPLAKPEIALNMPSDISVTDKALYVSDGFTHRVLKLTPSYRTEELVSLQ